MKNSRLVKMLFTIIMGIIMCVVMVGQVRAVDYQDLSSAINGTSTSIAVVILQREQIIQLVHLH